MPEGRPPPRNRSLGHLNAKFVASRHEIPRFLPQTGVFHETFRFLIGFTSHSDPSFKPGWRIQQLFRGSIYSVSAKSRPSTRSRKGSVPFA